MMRNRHLNAAEILRLIRDGDVTTMSDLATRFLARNSPGFRARLLRELADLIGDMERAGLITSDGGRLASTPMVDVVQRALDISLTELSRIARGAIPLNPIFGPESPSEETSEIFVLMPLLADLRPIYDDHIRTAAESVGMSIARADDFFAAESIIADIWRAIYGCQLIIADCTGRNPNVFYEIGIAHTVGRRTILVSQSMDDIPFDLRHRRCILYEYTPRGMRAFTETLVKTLEVEKRRGQGVDQ